MRVLVMLALLLALAPAAARERILDYGSDLQVRADGHLYVTETIRVRAEGDRIRRGIYRDFPTRYEDAAGNRVVVDFQLLGVERDGRPEAHFTETLSNGVRINTGNDDYLPPGEVTFTIRYRTTRQLGYFADHDELYWNVTGVGWEFPIDRAWARVHLPGPVPADQLRIDAYTGAYGERGTAVRHVVEAPGQVHFETTRGLMPAEGLSVSVGFPKGLVPVPTSSQRLAWVLRDNDGLLVAVGGLLLLAAFYWTSWHRLGRDPAPGSIFPRYAPPENFSAGEVRMLSQLGYDTRAFAADVVQMAVRGVVDIAVDDDTWTLRRRPDGDIGGLSHAQQAIARKLFDGSDEVVLKDSEAARVGAARAQQSSVLSSRLVPRLFVRNGGVLLAGVLFSAGVIVAACVVAQGSGIPGIVVAAVLMMVAHAAFAHWMKAPTPLGRKRLDEIEGLKLYLSVAEADAIAATPVPGEHSRLPPRLDAAHYEQLLPYALALDVEAAWSRRFTQAVGIVEAQRASPGWYHVHGGGLSSAMSFAGLGSSLGSALTHQISSAATPPGSSSGGGGGGFSGGGGGGGGGGGR